MTLESQQTVEALRIAVMIGGVITLISDLDRPRESLITVSQQPLLDLIEGLP